MNIHLTDVVALTAMATVLSASGRVLERVERNTRGIVTEINGHYFTVLFRTGACGEFVSDEIRRVAPALA